MKTAEEILKSKLDGKITFVNNPDYTFNKVIEAMEEYRLQSHPSPMSAEQVEVLHAIMVLAEHGIPGYAFGDNEAACEMDNRLSEICRLASTTPSVKADGWVSVEEKQRLEQIIELKEKERQEWANMCISKQKRIDELENPLKAAPPNVNN